MASGEWRGQPLRRLEDARLLSGNGCFTDDLSLAGEAHAAFVRSPHAHARIVGIDAGAARAAPGVVAVFTGAELVSSGLTPLPYVQMHNRPDGTPMTAAPRRALSAEAARFVGDAVAMVVAETRDEARDAAERVEVEWDPLPAAAHLRASAEEPVVWAPAFTTEHGNLAAIYRKGDRNATDEAFAAARHVVRLKLISQRVVANPLEPRALLAQYDPEAERFTLYCPTQNTHTVRNQLARVLQVPEERIRIVCRDLGGGFGTRGYAYPEHAALCFAARALGRPVKWRADRSENFLSEVHGRDSVTEAELAIGAEHRFTGLRIRTLANVGAYVSNFGACVPAMSGARAPTGVYDIANLDHEVRMLYTHTAPVDAYRGAGRPEIGYMLERLVARAARELGMDEVALRMKNLVRAEAMPYRNPAGEICDCGDFPKLLQHALCEADWEGYATRKADANRAGKLYGRGVACYVEVTGSARLTESVDLAFDPEGRATLVSGTQPIGQGIQTSYAQVVADALGIAPQSVQVLQGDSDVAHTGGGAGASRSLQVGGSAALKAAQILIELGRRFAASELEASPGDLEFSAGRYRIAGTDRGVSLAQVAATQPERRLNVRHTETVQGMTWPNGCYVCEAEVDADTGDIGVARLTSCDDIGAVLNPLIATGQVHGGIAQGLGQALMEQALYDDGGQLMTGSFMDYAMPRAGSVPELVCRFDESVPTARNALGAKGVGEIGCHGAMPALVNAVLDALAERGDVELDMPLTGEKIWRALHR